MITGKRVPGEDDAGHALLCWRRRRRAIELLKPRLPWKLRATSGSATRVVPLWLRACSAHPRTAKVAALRRLSIVRVGVRMATARARGARVELM